MNLYRFSLGAVLTAILMCIWAMCVYADATVDASGFNVERIESEIKLAVPGNQLDQVWNYIVTQYSPEISYLSQYGNDFTADFSEEVFVDIYFDTPDYALRDMYGGIRHRTRYVSSGDDRDIKELLQIKVSGTSINDVSRTEIKFPVKHYSNKKALLDIHPVIGLVPRKQRSEFIQRVQELGIDPLELNTALMLSQKRRRAYIARGDESFATLTLDVVSYDPKMNDHFNHSDVFTSVADDLERIGFVELELELNEVNYTDGDALERAFMEKINSRMKDDILEAFPQIYQDQTPKYNKALNRVYEFILAHNIQYDPFESANLQSEKQFLPWSAFFVLCVLLVFGILFQRK